MSRKTDVHTIAGISAAARHWSVSRTTIYQWIARGNVVMFAKNKIDITASEALLKERPQVYRGGIAHGPHAQD